MLLNNFDQALNKKSKAQCSVFIKNLALKRWKKIVSELNSYRIVEFLEITIFL